MNECANGCGKRASRGLLYCEPCRKMFFENAKKNIQNCERNKTRKVEPPIKPVRGGSVRFHEDRTVKKL